ncbi:MAG: pilus assembly protein [Rhodospirillales bacterium]|nr:pilus assembly protein [Alphaproteobacteria bacterium]USO04507.1 MAG: pilus assembly protein [Rhodospirillales bacterium]
MLNSFLMRTKILAWWVEDKAVALTEAAILFPVLLSLLMGVYDLGQGVVVNQKVMSASQVVGDLITRYEVVNMDLVNDIILAGKMALEPYPTGTFGYDIASIEFDEDGDPVVLWRVTQGMPANDTAVASTAGFAEEGEGLVVVSVAYEYTPFFADFVVDQIDMREVAFLRGRKSATIACTDCPS